MEFRVVELVFSFSVMPNETCDLVEEDGRLETVSLFLGCVRNSVSVPNLLQNLPVRGGSWGDPDWGCPAVSFKTENTGGWAKLHSRSGPMGEPAISPSSLLLYPAHAQDPVFARVDGL